MAASSSSTATAIAMLNVTNPSIQTGLTMVIDMTGHTRCKCSFCGIANHNITQCAELTRFENQLLEKWRENLNTPDVFVDWVYNSFESKMVPYTRRIYALNQQKTCRFDEFACLNAICNRMNSLHLSSFIEASIQRNELLQQEQLLEELEAEQLQSVANQSFLEDQSNSTVNKKRKVLLIYDDEAHASRDCTERDCGICLDSFPRKHMVSLNCGHLFCTPCGVKLRQEISSCASCRLPITETTVSSLETFDLIKRA
jgi:hypothetical protein